jgi:hypothetical protein
MLTALWGISDGDTSDVKLYSDALKATMACVSGTVINTASSRDTDLNP